MMKSQWRDKAACRGVDTEVFMPDGRRYFSQKKKREALSYCTVCPVKQDCLEFAFEHDIKIGFYGGMDGDERRYAKRVWVRKRKAAEQEEGDEL